MRIRKQGRRFWRVEEEDGTLVCVTVYKKGAKEVARRLSGPRELLALAAHVSRHPLTLGGHEMADEETAWKKEAARAAATMEDDKRGED